MKSVIKWIDYSKEKPPIASKWVIAVLKPVNYMEFIDNPSEMNDWIRKFGINKVWIHNGSFWLNHKDISDRVTHWSEIPSVPIYDKI